MNDIPHDVESFYEEATHSHKKIDMTTLTQLLISYSQKFCIYAIFDAIDECNEGHLQDILSLFVALETSFKVLISTRPHLQNLRNRLSNMQIFNVSADEADLENYVNIRVKSEENNDLRLGCLDLIKGVQGMYIQCYIIQLTAGFYLRDSNWTTFSAAESQGEESRLSRLFLGICLKHITTP